MTIGGQVVAAEGFLATATCGSGVTIGGQVGGSTWADEGSLNCSAAPCAVQPTL